MITINFLPFGQLKNAEHVAFFNNVVLELGKFDVSDLGVTTEQLGKFKQAVCLASADSPLATYKAPLEKYILGKYSTDIVALPYQEESAHLAGFDLDMRTRFTDEELEQMGIGQDLGLLKTANDTFSDMYNQRANERAGSTAELTKKLRAETEEQYDFFRLHIEYMANTAAETEKGKACANVLGVINEYVRDARLRINQRQGKVESGDPELGDDV